MIIRELWRYPVKSMNGQRLDSVEVTERGFHADRLWAVRDLQLGATTTARRLPALMQCDARFVEEPPVDVGPGRVIDVLVTFPDGETLSSSDPLIHRRLTELVGRPVELRSLPAVADKAQYRGPRLTQADLRRQFDIPDGEPLPDISKFPLAKVAQLARYATPVGSFADAYPLHILTSGSLAAMRRLAPDADFDARRFRPNIVVDGSDEFSWCSGTLASRGVIIEPIVPTLRCSMPIRRQHDLEAQPEIMRTIKDRSDRCLGIYANVDHGGNLAVGDRFHFTPPKRPGTVSTIAERIKIRVLRAGAVALPRGRAD